MTYDDLKEKLKNNIGKEDNLLQGFSFENASCEFKDTSEKYYCYEDSCNEYMFTRGLFLAKDKLSTKKSVLEVIIKSIEIDQWGCPILIKIPSKKLMKESLNDVSEKQKQTFKENMKTVFSFLNNSSIWVRVVDENDKEAEQKTKDEFKAFAGMGLYEYESAEENFTFNSRIQLENWLEGDHGHDVTPILYGNESEFGEKLFKEHLEELKKSFRFIDDFHDVAFRILLIDDKIGKKKDPSGRFRVLPVSESAENKDALVNDQGGEVTGNAQENSGQENPKGMSAKVLDIKIEECSGKCQSDCPISGTEPCKLCTIKEILKYPNKDEDKKNDYHYWNQVGIQTFYCPTVIKDFIEDDDKLGDYDGIRFFKKDSGEKEKIEKEEKIEHKKFVKIECDFAPQIDRNDSKVQIVGVRDVRTALLLMCKFKFDMVFCDYLLDYKEENNGERDYAKQLFEFLSYDYKNEIKNEKDPSKKKRLEVLEQLCREVLDNRGPLDKLWIMPVTGFNQTFIQDLYRNRIDLIGHKWNISNGADPITTPWQFLYHLNKFIELQLKSCVYRMDHLLRFVKYTCEDLQDLKAKNENNNRSENGLRFFEFQSFMGSEYANFMRRYGNRHLIQRDAVCENGTTENKSVFATYVWKAFYIEPKNRDVIELNRLIQRFLHQASTMHNDRNGQQRLEETFGQLCLFIDTNLKVRETIKKEEDLKDDKLENELFKLRSLMDELTNSARDDNKK